MPAAAVPSPGSERAPEELLVQVDVNRQGLNETVIVLRRDARLYFAREDLERWRLKLPGVEPLMHNGQAYYPVERSSRREFRAR